jgi:hypothetical protein
MSNVKQYRKKPVVIEAVLWDETQETLKALLLIGFTPSGYSSHTSQEYVRKLDIWTPEGTMRANKGDYIIKGIKGEFYPCKPDIFKATYEEVES